MKSIVYYSRKDNTGTCPCGNKAVMKIGRKIQTHRKVDKRILEFACMYCYQFYKKIPLQE